MIHSSPKLPVTKGVSSRFSVKQEICLSDLISLGGRGFFFCLFHPCLYVFFLSHLYSLCDRHILIWCLQNVIPLTVCVYGTGCGSSWDTLHFMRGESCGRHCLTWLPSAYLGYIGQNDSMNRDGQIGSQWTQDGMAGKQLSPLLSSGGVFFWTILPWPKCRMQQ